ncbi:site-specific integrase [Bacillus inaquosorum]|uniref:Phage integrase n=1 Tax=Bacillus inaquosorum KCTC 13429 TaxID=1236548 RepID=A0A9W5PBG6_9BACI|nr:site-specific integrase [Bacillus inaquosorum]AWM17211.1 site-specific integrase [Bacillus inaquosorum]ELS59584.1 phage integrase [Bacillus inaquosorum KCTC 13429]
MTKIKKDDKTGTYYFVYSGGTHPITKKRIQRKRKGIKTYKEAEQKLKQVIIEVEKEKQYLPKITDTFGEYALTWLESKRVKRASTYINYREILEYNVLPYLAEYKFDELTEEILQKQINTLYFVRKIAPDGIRRAVQLTRSIFKKAARRRKLDVSIFDELNLPSENKRVETWTPEEITRFLDLSQIKRPSRHFIAYEISIKTGMRMGEVLGLEWKSINWKERYVTIRQTLCKIDEKGNYGLQPEVKTVNSYRKISIPKSLCESLLKHKRLVEKDKKEAGAKYNDLDLVVCTKLGNWLPPCNWRRGFHSIRKQLGLPKIKPHALRHTHATYLISIGVNPKIVQERLGHSDIKQTLGTYSHALPSMQLEAADKMDLLLKS